MRKVTKLNPYSLAHLRQTNREYTKSNRADWSELGFRSMTCLVHDDEREEVLAEMEVRKCAALVALAENKNPDPHQISVLSRRNMTTLPLGGELKELEDQSAATLIAKDVMTQLGIARNYIKRFRGIEANFEKADSDEKRVNMAARAVAYSAACAAQIRLVKAMLKAAPLRDNTVFGARGEVEEEDAE